MHWNTIYIQESFQKGLAFLLTFKKGWGEFLIIPTHEKDYFQLSSGRYLL